ncbi:uncharacterized protein LOC125032375 [Penaeus chinensis]|uniref:uncharacterized protein LOC125032375 n=1 Tax=Penaeus chinensis TaxID=139456 RepID=UPI001FB78822|nr:uncharacterized protein LOC125032375 [Penaeus chinensis]
MRHLKNLGLPIIQELTHKYGLQADFGEATLGQKLEELREHIRKEIRKELKIKEGAENLRKVTTDRRAFQDVSHMVKEANSKLSALQQELQELDSQILLTQGQGGASLDSSFSNNLGHDGQGRCRAASAPRDRKSTRGALTVLSPGVNARRSSSLDSQVYSLAHFERSPFSACIRSQGSESKAE